MIVKDYHHLGGRDALGCLREEFTQPSWVPILNGEKNLTKV